MLDGKFAEACPQLEQSQRLEPRLGTRLNIAFCHERLGKLATAWSGFQEAAAQARREGNVAREQFATARALALAPRVPWLGVHVADGGDSEPPTIWLDGAPLAARELGKELPIDPGSHVLIARQGGDGDGDGDGEEYWRTTLLLRESEHANVTIPAAPPRVLRSAPDPRRDTQAVHPREADTSRFVYELGAFLGYIEVDSVSSSAAEPGSIQATIQDATGSTRLLRCDAAFCDYPPLGPSSGLVAGVSGFVGYALTEPVVDLGLRFLLGPRLGGGALIALGPSASIPLDERFRVGPTVFFGTASHAGTGNVEVSTLGGFDTVHSRLTGTINFAWGFGTELGVTLISRPSGTFVLQATPLYFFGWSGSAWSLPIGAAYHWN